MVIYTVIKFDDAQQHDIRIFHIGRIIFIEIFFCLRIYTHQS